MHTTSPANGTRVLAVNAGSSSVKFAAFGADGRAVARGKLERVGSPDEVLARLDADGLLHHLAGVGHRFVHGGPDHTQPELLSPELLRDLDALSTLDPTHLPAELGLVRALAARLPGVPQVACFDTAFHRDLPAVARTLPLPRRYTEQGIRRYGFHGISYEYLLEEFGRVAGPWSTGGRVVLAHLGSGASLAAVLDGKCVDTTMGFTPTGGLVMGTRTGDLDPGALLYLLRSEQLTAGQLDAVVNRESGLRGISGTSSDVRELLAHAPADPRAAEAVDVFCYSVRKWIGAMAGVLGGLDSLVFSGGIGENSPEVRARICDGLGFLGVRIAADRNAANESVISAGHLPTTVLVIRTDEEAMIARTVARLLNRTPTEEPTHG